MKNQNTIFEGNKTFTEVLVEGVLFAIGSITALMIGATILIIFTNLIY